MQSIERRKIEKMEDSKKIEIKNEDKIILFLLI